MTRGPIIDVTVTAYGAIEVAAWLAAVERRLDDRDRVVRDIVRASANIWRQNFEEEGSMVGGWADLKESTIEERESLGFGAGPKLYRYGHLKSAVIEMPATIGNGSYNTYSKVDTQGGSIKSYFQKTGAGSATLVAEGDKAVHQTGSGPIPPRPYWFVNDAVYAAATDATLQWLEREVLY